MQQSFDLGTVSVALVSDGRADIEGDRVFYPASQEEWEVGLNPDAEGNLPIAYRSLLISDSDALTLVDTGYGEEGRPDRKGRHLPENLAALDVSPAQIDRVVITHAHGDHCMGNTLWRSGGWIPAFPNADYVIQEKEIAAIRENDDPLWVARFAPLMERDQLRLIDGRTALTGTIACWPTPGHTIGHQSVLVRSEAQQALFMGDLAVFAKNMEYSDWGPVWAWSREHDARSRQRIAEWAVEQDAILIIGHDPQRPWVKLRRDGNSYRFVSLAEQ
jgi:glyoxylase-like metal-dependent hydrolase (beta-lactamase superfamily II)